MKNYVNRELQMRYRDRSAGIICVDQCQIVQKKVKNYHVIYHGTMPPQNYGQNPYGQSAYPNQPPPLMHHATAPAIPANYGVQNPQYPVRPAYGQQQPPQMAPNAMPYGQPPNNVPYGHAAPPAAPYGQPAYPPQQQPYGMP